MAVKIELGRRYRFAASHRLHTKKLSEEENTRIFGKCANPYGHGHNYVLEISVSGDIDPATGMIANLADLATTENLCIEIFERLKSFPKAKLERVRVQETANNSFEYAGK